MKAERGVDVGKKYSVTNLVTNGNFANGTTGWTGYQGSISVSNNIASIVGDGSASVSSLGKLTSIPYVDGKKVYVRAKIKVTNDVCNVITLQTIATGMTTIISTLQTTPVNGNQYTLSTIVPLTSGGSGNLEFRIRQQYADATIANGKLMEIQEVDYVVLTDDFAGGVVGTGLEPSKEWCDANIGITWFEGVKVLN